MAAQGGRTATLEGHGNRPCLVRHHLDGNNREQALAVAREAVNTQPDNLSALELLARAQSTAGEHTNAASTLVRALALQPDSADLHYQFAMVQGARRQTDKARASSSRRCR